MSDDAERRLVGTHSAFGPVGTAAGARATSTGVGGMVPETNTAEAGLSHPGYRAPSPDADAQAPLARRRTLIVGAIYDTFGQTSARIAAVWITILVLCAVFAPFLANSRPYVARWADGRVTYPLFASLTWVDLSLVAAFVAVSLLVVLRRFADFRFSHGLLAMLGLIAIAAPVSWFVADPPQLETYEVWREANVRGELKGALMAPVPYSPNDAMRDADRDRPQQPPGARHWLGTTQYGEDLLSRMIFATRVALAIGFISTGISACIGIVIGGVMGYLAGTTDLLLMRVVEITEAIPQLVVLMIVTQFFGKNIWLMMVTIGLIAWTGNARFIRAEFLRLRKQDFVQAGVAAGLPLHNLLFRHMLPNGVAPVLVNVSFGIASAILLESVLSFLGLGLEAKDASWGQLLDQARQGGAGFNWWIATFPGLAIFLTVFAYILIGEAMRDAIDPKLKKAGE